jgi:3-hydroxymyristoyl/3-hydroxydecanoyl-(acyl carrier protein) dehydratase
MQTLAVTRDIAPDHPAFAGHFPGRPLLPGALLLAEVMEAARGAPGPARRLADAGTLAAAKFLAPVPPGARLEIALAWDETTLRFAATHAGVVVARGHWRLEEAA